MYDARYSPAPRDVMTVFVPAVSKTLGGQEQVSLQLPTSGTYYVSIMAVDAKGVAIGKTNYMLTRKSRSRSDRVGHLGHPAIAADAGFAGSVVMPFG